MDRAEAIGQYEELSQYLDIEIERGEKDGYKMTICKMRRELYSMAIAALREQETVTNRNGLEWISVKERLPELEKEVLICDLNDERDERPYMDVWSLEDDEDGGIVWAGKDGAWYSLDDATHWMPLPEPPKEGADHE